MYPGQAVFAHVDQLGPAGMSGTSQIPYGLAVDDRVNAAPVVQRGKGQ